MGERLLRTRDGPEAAGIGTCAHTCLDVLEQAGRQSTIGNITGMAGNGPKIAAKPYEAVKLTVDGPALPALQPQALLGRQGISTAAERSCGSMWAPLQRMWAGGTRQNQ